MRLKDTNIKKKKTQKNIVIVNTTFQQVSNNFFGFICVCVLCPSNRFYVHIKNKLIRTNKNKQLNKNLGHTHTHTHDRL
jgi:hypothetical protein